MEYFLVHGSNFTHDLLFKWLGGGDRFQLDPVSKDRLMEQGILELVEEPVSARMFNMASLKSISAIASLLHEKYD